MPTPSERKALAFFAAAILLGAGVRTVRSLSGAPAVPEASRSALAGQIAAVEASRAGAAAGRSKAAAPPAIVNVNAATAAQLQALPRVGPVLAGRIVAYRDSAGPFRSLRDLDNVKGIGPAMLAELQKRVTF